VAAGRWPLASTLRPSSDSGQERRPGRAGPPPRALAL